MFELDLLLNIYIEGFYNEYPAISESNNDDIVATSVDLAYGDTKRVLHGIGDLNEKKKGILKDIADTIKEKSMNGFSDQDAFNSFHSELCKKWTDGFKENAKLNQFGKAQKIVNMSLKYYYTYCYKNKSDMENIFEFCHFTLDSYTLKWLNSCRIVERKPDCLNSNTTWSNLNATEYKKIQQYAKKCINETFEGMWPIKAEFIVWKGVMLHDVLSSWIKVKNNYPDEVSLNEVVDYIIREGKLSLQDTIKLLIGCN